LCVLRFKGQDGHGIDIVKRNAADYYHRDKSRIAVNILHERKSHDGDGASVTRLNECADDGLVLDEKARAYPYDNECGGRDGCAVQDKCAVKGFNDVRSCHVLEDHDGEADVENEFVCRCDKSVREHSHAVQDITDDDDQKYGHCRI